MTSLKTVTEKKISLDSNFWNLYKGKVCAATKTVYQWWCKPCEEERRSYSQANTDRSIVTQVYSGHISAFKIYSMRFNMCSISGRFASYNARHSAKFNFRQITFTIFWDFSGGSDGKESTCKVGDLGSIPGLERSLAGEGNGYPLQYSGLENSMDRGAQDAIVHRVAKSQAWLGDFQFIWSKCG